MEFLEIKQGLSPLILCFPHTGPYIPDAINDTLNEQGREKADTDWHLHALYDGLAPEATSIRTCIHRYVIDCNRDPQGKSLYPGQNTTDLVPLTDFDGLPLHKQVPTPSQINARLRDFHRPYHTAIETQIERVKAAHGFAIVYDCHSIRSNIPFLFEGTLPHFNIGTNEGKTCAPSIEKAVYTLCEKAQNYSVVLNGRFKGGWTTRHYGLPDTNVHAVQMEIAQRSYMIETTPWTYETNKAQSLRSHLKEILDELTNWNPQ